MRNRLVRFDDGKDSLEKSERGCLRYIVKSIVAIVGLHLSMSVFAYTITVSYPTGGGAAVAPSHEIRTEVVDGVEWTYMTGFLYIEQDSRPNEVLYADWISMNPNGASGLMAVPGYWGVYIGDGTNAAVSASISGHVNVPSELGGMRVIGISANAFWNCTGMTGVTVPDTVLKIQEAAFGRCSGLEEMTLPFIGEERGVDEWAGWTVLGWVFGRTWDIFAGAETTYYDNRWEEREFDGGRFFTMDLAEDRPRITKGSGFCLPAGLKKLTITDETVLARKALCDQPLTEVVLPETLRSMYSGTFENMPLKQVVIPSGIKTIEDSLFSGCTSLTNVVLHSGVTKIGGSAFRNCINLKHIDIPASVTSIGGNAFNHTGLSDIPAMPGMKCIADEMFVDCWEMTKATIPEGITSIGRNAFLRCPLAEVTIPNTVTNIGHYAFDNQRLISEIEIPSSVKSIGVVAFHECTNLTHVVLAEGLESIGDNAFSGCTALTNITIPESVSKLGINEEGDRLLGGVFRNCTSLESIVLPSTLAELPSSTFYGCKRLVDVALPSNLKSIGDWAFCDCDALVAVDIPQGVTNLGSSVFLRCDGLERVSVPDSVARIEDDTFYLCTNLVNVSLQDGPQSIGRDAFYECKKLERINIPGSVRTIGIDAFKDCSGLSQLTFNEGLEELGWGAFRGCLNVESLVFPSSLKVLGGAAFWGWKEISNVVIPSNVEVINSQAFEGCTGLKSVEIECGVRSIESNAFGGCTGLESIEIPDSVISIGASAFSTCTSLTSVHVGSGVREIGGAAFANCSSLEEVYVSDISRWCVINFADANANPLYSARALYVNGSEIVELTLPESVTNICSYAFAGCDGLESVILPTNVCAVANNAFYQCRRLKAVFAPETLENLGMVLNSANNGCPGYLSVVYYDGAAPSFEGMPRSTIVFNGNGGEPEETYKEVLSNMPIGEIMPRLSWTGHAFVGWFTEPNGGVEVAGSTIAHDGLTAYAHWAEPIFTIENGMLMAVDTKGAKEIEIPQGVTSIGEMVFYWGNCSGLEKVVIPCSVTNIGYQAFMYCSDLRQIEIPDSVEHIGAAAFAGCENLESIALPKNMTVIEDSTFSGCMKLQDIVIPENVMNIGEHAFARCEAIERVFLPNSITNIDFEAFYDCIHLKNIEMPENVKTIKPQVFYGCIALVSIDIPRSVTNICYEAFCKCASLENVSLPEGIKSIGWQAFAYCDNLSSISIPDSVECIGKNAFINCSALLYDKTSIPGLEMVDGWIVDIKGGDYDELDLSGISGICDNALVYYSGKIHSLVVSQYICDQKLYSLLPHSYTSISNIVCSHSVTNIGAEAFLGCSNLISFTMSESLEGIEESAFQGCSRLMEVCVPDRVNYIGWSAFRGCSSMTNIVIGKSVDYIGSMAFKGCSRLASIVIPENVTEIGGGAFEDSGLTDVIIPGSVTRLKWTTFACCGKLTNVTICAGVENIDSQSFLRCESLTSITIPSSVVDIGDYAFEYCTSLEFALIPSSLDGIEEEAVFKGCSDALAILYYEGEPPDPSSFEYAILSFDANGGIAENEIKKVLAGHAIGKLPAATREGFDFIGWFTSAVGGEIVTEQTIFGSNVALFAHWRKIKVERMEPTMFGGDACWIQESDGSWRSGAISHNGRTSAMLSENGPGRIVFNWKTSSESGYDKLHFYVNDVEVVSAISGEMSDWAFVEYEVAESGMVVIKWEYTKDISVSSGSDCGWIKDVVWMSDAPIVPAIDGDDGATVEGDADSGYVIKPTAAKREVVVTIPEGVDASKVTVEISSAVESVKANGAMVKVVANGCDITSHLDIPAAIDGVVDMTKATVKEEVVKEAMDTSKGAVIDITPASPMLTTAETKPGLTYTLREGATLGGMVDGDSKVGDGEKWTPNITVKGGASGFYTIKVEK